MWSRIRVGLLVSSNMVLHLAILPQPSQAGLVTYNYTGPQFAVATAPFTSAGSVTGTMTIDAPAVPGTLAGIGDITDISFSASLDGVSTAFTFSDLSLADLAPSWFFTFDGAGDISDWSLLFIRNLTGGPDRRNFVQLASKLQLHRSTQI